MTRVSSALSGPVPRGIRVAFAVLTVVVVGLAVLGAVRGVWFLTVVCGLLALLNLGALWTTRGPKQPSEPAAD
jgi:hypothetical protein